MMVALYVIFLPFSAFAMLFAMIAKKAAYGLRPIRRQARGGATRSKFSFGSEQTPPDPEIKYPDIEAAPLWFEVNLENPVDVDDVISGAALTDIPEWSLFQNPPSCQLIDLDRYSAGLAQRALLSACTRAKGLASVPSGEESGIEE